jgi:uncharacterized delta-60 repeat protein
MAAETLKHTPYRGEYRKQDNVMLIIAGGAMRGRIKGIQKKGAITERLERIRRLAAPLLILLLVLALSATNLHAKGGDYVTPFPLRDNYAGKQTATASAVDSQGNIIVTGSQTPPGSSFEEYYTVKVLKSGSIAWRAIYKKPGFSARAVAIAVDSSDNIIVTGNVSGANPNVLTVKYAANPVLNPDGTAQESWSANFDGGGSDSATAIAVTVADGKIYVGGSSRYAGNESFMVLKYLDNGSSAALEWQIPNIQTSTIGKVRALAADASGVVVTGQTWNATDHFLMTVSYDTAGQKQWEKQYLMASPPPGHIYNDIGLLVKFDSNRHVVVSGSVSNGDDSDIYTAKYCSSSAPPCSGKVAGDLYWEMQYDGGSDDEPNAMVIDKESAFLDNVYLTSHVMAETGRYHIYTARYQDAPGAPLVSWQSTFNSGNDNTDIPAAMAADTQGSLYVTGYTDISGNTDFQTVKYRKNNGAELWSRRFNGSANKNDRTVGIGLDPTSGQLYVAGYADETAPLDGISTTTSGSTKDLLEDTSRTWAENRWAGYYVMLTSGPYSGQYRPIVSNTPTTLTFGFAFPGAVASGETYYIYDNDNLDIYVLKYDQGVVNAPNNLTAKTLSNSSIKLEWQDNNDTAPKFRIERCTSGTTHLIDTPCNFDNPGEITVIPHNPATDGATTKADTGLTPNLYYYYRVIAYTGSDYATAEQVTHPSNVAHAITQFVNEAPPSGSHIYAGIANNDDYAFSIAVGPDNKPVVTGKSFFDPGGFDYYTIKLDRNPVAGVLPKLWSQRFDDPEAQSDVAMCLAIDRNNQIIVSGYAYLHNFIVNQSINSIYTIKYLLNAAPEPEVDTDLINQWDDQYNGPGNVDDRPTAIATTTDANNNIAVVGYGVHSGADLSDHDIYVLYYTKDGPDAPGYWATTPINKGEDDQPTALAFDPDGNVIITGFTQKAGGTNDYDIYTAKLCGSATSKCPKGKLPGDIIWEDIFDSGNGDDMANSVAVDATGAVYVTGFATNSQKNKDFITIKYSKDGDGNGHGVRAWPAPKWYNGPANGDDEALVVKIDPVDGAVVVAGTRLTDINNNDFHLMRYQASDGAELWGSAGRTLLREFNNDYLIDMGMDSSGNIFMTGNTSRGSSSDILSVKFDPLGNISGDVTIYGTLEHKDAVYGIAVNSLGEAFVAGYTLNAAPNADYLVLKIDGSPEMAPSPFNGTATYTTATLSWQDVATLKGGHYHLKRKAGSCEDPGNTNPETDLTSLLATPTSTSFIDTGLTQESTYCYSVQHENGPLSRWVNRTVTTGTPAVPYVAPVKQAGIPYNTGDTGYGAKAVDTTTVKLVWEIPAYIQTPTGFDIYRCQDSPGHTPCSGSDFTYLATVNGNTTNYYTDATVCPGSTYRYQVKGVSTTTGAIWSSLFSSSSGVILPTVDNLIVDGGYESVDPTTPWYSPVGGNLNGTPSSNPVAVQSGVAGMMLSADNSAVTSSSDWNRSSTPTQSATVGNKVAITSQNDSSGLVQLGWRAKRELTGLAADTVTLVTIPRDGSITDGTEPQAGFRDIRFYDSVAKVELPYLIVGSNATSATVWFKTGANSSGVSLYYGNDTAAIGSNANVAILAQGIKQPVLLVNGGKYNISAWVKSNLNKGRVIVDFNPMGTSVNMIDSKAGNVNVGFNNDNAWHNLSETVTSTITTSGANSFVRTYFQLSSGDTSVPANYPSGQAYIDNVQVTPVYNLTATAASEMQINLSWTDSVYDESGYKIERCSSGCGYNAGSWSGTWDQVAVVLANTTSYSDGALTPGTNYSYRIRPFKTFSQVCSGSSGWDGGYSNLAAATTSNAPPGSFSATAANTTKVNLSWTDPSVNETEFRVVRGTGADCNSLSPLATVLPGSGSGSTISYSDTTACHDSTYTYCVKSVSQGLSTAGLSQAGGGKWTSKTKLSFSSFTPNTLVKTTINQLTGMDATFKDIRFLDAAAGVELPYWIQNITGSTATVWFRTGNSDNIYLYFANNSAISSSSVTNVFGSGLVGFWPFEEASGTWSGTTADQSGNAKNATLRNFTNGSGYGVVSGGMMGNGLNLNGTNNFANIADTTGSVFDFTDQVTVELWYQYQKSPDWARIVSKSTTDGGQPWDLFGLSLDNSSDATATNPQQKVYFGVGSVDSPPTTTTAPYYQTSTGPKLTPGQWYHIAGRYSSVTGDMSLFVNGTEYGSVNLSTKPKIVTNNAYLVLGGRGDASNNWNALKGVIDEVRVFNRALTNAEIKARYAATLPTITTPTQATVVSDSNGLQPELPVAWDSPFSSATATTQPIPAAPVLQASGVVEYAENQIDVTFTFPTGKDQEGFKIDRCSDNLCNTILQTITAVNSTVTTGTAGTWKYKDTGLPYNTTYYYRVRAYKTEDPLCNSGIGFWETASSAIYGASTTLQKPTSLTGGSSVWTDCNDLRFTDAAGNKQEYFIESGCNSGSTKINVKVGSIPAGGTSLYLYHGNLAASPGSNGLAVFEFFDDFTGSDLDTTKWTRSDWTGFSVSNGYLHGTNTTGNIFSIATYNSGYTVQAKVKSPTIPTNGFIPLGLAYTTSRYYDVALLQHPGADHYRVNNAWTANGTTPPTGTAETDTMIYSLSLKSTTVFNPQIYDVDKSVTYWNAGDITMGNVNRQIWLGTRPDGYTGQSYVADWDWVRVRKYVANEPTFGTLGTATSSSYSLTGETTNWRFRRSLPVTYGTGLPTLSNFQITLTTDTTQMGTDRTTLTWRDNTATENGFKVERCLGTTAECNDTTFTIEKFFPVPSQNGVGSNVTYYDTDTTIATGYCYRIKATKATEWLETDPSNVVCVTTSNPGAPENLIATASTSKIDLSWTDKSSGETGFKLERCKDPDAVTPCDLNGGSTSVFWLPPNDNALSTTATYSDTDSICAGTYRYRISAYKDYPNGTSWSRGPTNLTGDFVSTGLPAAPEKVVASRVSEQEILVTWTDKTTDETGFEVWRCAGSSTCTDFQKLGVTAPSASGVGSTVTFNDRYSILPGTTYRYQIRAIIGGTCPTTSDPSAPNSAAPPNGPDYATATINAPGTFKATGTNTTQADLAWTDTTNAESGFLVRRCPGLAPCSTTYTDLTTAAAGALTYPDPTVCSGTTYNYSVAPVEHPTLPFNNSGGTPWKSLSQLSFTDFKANFITRVSITKGSMDIQDDFRDIRFYDRNTLQELPYWIQKISGTGVAATAIVWFKTGSTSGIDLYYGNPSATSSSNSDAVFGSGLVGYWPFEEPQLQTTGTVSDVTGSGNHLAMTGFATPYGIVTNGKFGNALSLDGVGDYLYKNGAITGLPTGNVISVEAWVQPTWDPALPAWTSGGYRSPYDYNGIVSWGNRDCLSHSIAMSLNPTGYPQVPTWCNDSFSSGPALNFNQWNHYVFTLNNRTVKFFVNGVESTGLPLDSAKTVAVTSQDLLIGALQNQASYRNFKGLLDEVRIYNRELTSADITARYTATMPSVTIGPQSNTGFTGTASIASVVLPSLGNLATNGDFESGTSSWSAWATDNNHWGGITSDTAKYLSGGKSMKFSKTLQVNHGSSLYQLLTGLIPGGSYTLKGYINATLASGGNAFCRVANWAADVNYVSPSMEITASDATRNNQGWIGFSVPFTLPMVAPGGGSISSLNIECGIYSTVNTSQTAWFDAIELVPDQPIKLTATRASEVDIDLQWTDKFIDETGFNIYRCQGSTCTNFALVKQLGPGNIRYRDPNLTIGQDYRYKITAYKTASCPWESAPSNIAMASTTQVAPVLLSVASVNATTMRLTWTDNNATESGYNIERCEDSSCTGPTPNFTEIYHNVLPTSTLDATLKARYTFNGNLNDSSSSGLHFSPYYNTATYEENGLVLASDARFVTTTTNILNTDYHTIEFDIKFRSTPPNSELLKFSVPGANFSPGLTVSGNRIYWYNYPSGTAVIIGIDGVSGTPFAVGTWYRVRGVKNGNNLKIYVDETLVANATVSSPKTAGSGTLTLGYWYTPDVAMKNLSIYNGTTSPNERTFDDLQACPGKTYYYRVRANKEGDWGAGPVSNVLNDTAKAFNPPRAPTSATAKSDVRADLSWTANAENDQSGFVLKECPGANCTTGLSLPNQTSYSNSALDPETTYCYEVASYKATPYCNGGAGLTSAFIPVGSCVKTFSKRPAGFKATAVNSFKILLEWQDQSGDEDGFEVFIKLWNGEWLLRASVPANTQQFLDTIGIEPLKKYSYRVRAVRGADRTPEIEADVTYTDPNTNITINTTPPFDRGNRSTCP